MKCLLFYILFSILCSTALANEITAFSYTIDCNKPDRVKKVKLKYSIETDFIENISELNKFDFFINSGERMCGYSNIGDFFTFKKNKAFYIQKYPNNYSKVIYTMKKDKISLKLQYKNAFLDAAISNWFIYTPETLKPQIAEMNAKIYIESIFGMHETFLKSFPVKYSHKKNIVKCKKIKG